MSTTRRTREELTYPIVMLRQHGLSCRVIAHELGASFRTVCRVVHTHPSTRPVRAPWMDDSIDDSPPTPSSADEDPV